MYRSDIYRIVKKQKYNFHVRKKVQIKKLRRICNHRSFFICTLHYLFSTVPECFPKEETDPSIAEGKFDVSFAEYKYHFEVVGQSVVVHCMKTFEE